MSPSNGTLGNPLDQAAPTARSPLANRFRLALALGVACGVGAAAVVPYLAAMLPEIGEAGVPLWVIALVSAVQNTVLCTLLAFLGLSAAGPLGLEVPHLQRWLGGAPEGAARPSWTGLGTSVALGGGIAALVVVIDVFFLLPQLTPIGNAPPTPGPLLGLLASLYGGIAEEVIVRLFLLSVVAWGLVKVGVGRRPALVSAAVVAAVVFGALHLPTAVRLFELDAALVVRTLLLNVMLGLPFGLLFIRRGLEQAIASHFVADLVLHVVVPGLALLGIVLGAS
jgi:hypothetical protein